MTTLNQAFSCASAVSRDSSIDSARSSNRELAPSVRALLSVAAAIPSAGAGIALAQSAESSTEAKIAYFYYDDWQAGGENRIKVKSPMLWARSAFAESWELEGTFQIDDISGASPFYLDSLSGASGLGIEDKRNFGDVRLSKSFERYKISLGGAYSGEDDWTSNSASLEVQWWTEDKNTTLNFGVSPTWDRITSTNNQSLLERRRTFAWLAGVTQVLTPNSIAQLNLFYQNADGYTSDQYKFFDNRPRSRDEYGVVIRHNQFVESLDASLHTDYRALMTSWSVASHTVDVKWYQPLGEQFMLRPKVRYYTQTEAEFFGQEYPPTDFETFSTYDQRMAAFGSFSLGLKLEYALSEHISFDALIEWMEQRNSWALFSSGTDDISDFHARFTGFGVSGRF